MEGRISNRNTLLILIAINALLSLVFVKDTPGRVVGDYRVFYVAGEIVQQSPRRLYDLAYQRQLELAQFSEEHFSPYFHPPHELLLFAPLSKLPFAISLNTWRMLGLFCLAFSGILIGKAAGLNPLNAILLASSMYPMGWCLYLGQDSLLLLLLVSACFYFLRKEENVAAALVLALALFKPQIPAVVALAALAIGRKKFFVWFATFGSVLMGAFVAFSGRDGAQQIIAAEKMGESHLGVAAMPSVRGMIALLAGDHPWLAAVILGGALIAMFPIWRGSRSLEFAFSSAICVAGAFTPYIFAYDLVLLAIPLALIGKKPKRHDGAIGALLTSGLLLLLLMLVKATAFLVVPTLVLGLLTSRLASPEMERVPALEPDLQLS